MCQLSITITCPHCSSSPVVTNGIKSTRKQNLWLKQSLISHRFKNEGGFFFVFYHTIPFNKSVFLQRHTLPAIELTPFWTIEPSFIRLSDSLFLRGRAVEYNAASIRQPAKKRTAGNKK